MDIFDAVTTWLEQKKSTGTDKIYLNQASKTELSKFLELTRDETKLNAWLVEKDMKIHEAPLLQTLEPILEQVSVTPSVPDIQPLKSTIIEKPDPENTKIMAKEAEIEQTPPVLAEFSASVPIAARPPLIKPREISAGSEVLAKHSDYLFLKQLSPETKILIIGEQLYNPKLNQPFEKSKKLLQGMIEAMANFIKNKVKKEINLAWDTISLVEVCKKSYTEQDDMVYIQSQLSAIVTAVEPEVVLLMGALPTEALTAAKNSVLNIHGQWFNFQGVACMPTFHPDFLNRVESRKKEAWADLQKVIKFLSDRSV